MSLKEEMRVDTNPGDAICMSVKLISLRLPAPRDAGRGQGNTCWGQEGEGTSLTTWAVAVLEKRSTKQGQLG